MPSGHLPVRQTLPGGPCLQHCIAHRPHRDPDVGEAFGIAVKVPIAQRRTFDSTSADTAMLCGGAPPVDHVQPQLRGATRDSARVK